jgi:uncharacterized protein YjbI with pentapeptide repeats
VGLVLRRIYGYTIAPSSAQACEKCAFMLAVIKADLSGVDLSDATLIRVNLTNANMTNADFSNAYVNVA